MRRLIYCLVSLAPWLAPTLLAAGQDRAPDGAALYERHCASCHDAGAARAPTREQFRAMSPTRVLSAMETGAMITGSPRLHGGRLYVPVASAEEGTGSSPGAATSPGAARPSLPR